MTNTRIVATPKDFAWTKWTPKDIRRAADSCIARKKARYKEIKRFEGEHTFQNTVLALERSDYDISDDTAR